MNTTAQELGAERWSDYFDSIAPNIEGMHVTIEIMSEQLGDQVEAERLPLQTIIYDHHDNVLEIAVGGRGLRYPVLLRHFISSPQQIAIEEGIGSIPSAILVTDANDVRTLIRLVEPTTLPG
jgi:Family of unknown function (DUF5335)